ncbi:MAG: hypothetical protein FIA99_05435 [Ruminiclostridium sp.]|nr:hypothetical protein [Ruminiclostridium sp.]
MPNENDIGGKVGLDVTNFKTGISELNRQIKVIDSGFKAAAAGMEDWGKSEEGLESRIKSLNEITDLQKKKIEGLSGEYKKIAAEKGADSKAAQDLQTWINKENAALNRNQLELKNTTESLKKLKQEEEDAAKFTTKLHAALDKIGGPLGKIGGAIGKAAIAGIAAVGTAAAGAALGAFKLAKDAGKAADDLITLSNKTGITTERLQEMQYAARFIDVEVETMTGSMAKLTKSMDGARDGTGAQAEAFKKLGIEFKNQDGSLRNAKDVWTEAIDALGNVSSEADRDALAMNLFGKSAQELNPLIKAGSEELNRLGKEAHDVGAVLGDDAVQQAGKFDDMMQTMEASMKGLAATAGVAVMPAVMEIVKTVSGVIPAITKAVKTGNFGEAGKAISDGISGLLSKVTGALPGLATMATNIIGGLASTIVTAIPQVLPPLIGATVQLLNTLIQVLIDNGPMLIDAGVNALMTLIDGIVQALPKLIDAAIKMILALQDALWDNLPQLIKAAIQIVITLAKGIIENLPKLIDQIPKMIDAIVKAVIENLPILILAAIEIVGALIIGILQSIPKLIAVVPQLFKSLFEAFKEIKWGELGLGIINGIIDGIKNAAKNLAKSVVDTAKAALNGVKNFLGIKSPSTVMRDQVGKMIGAGMAEGIAASAKQINNAMRGLNTDLTDGFDFPSPRRGGDGSAGGGAVIVNVPLSLDGREVTRSTGRVQVKKNQSYSRALGVSPA